MANPAPEAVPPERTPRDLTPTNVEHNGLTRQAYALCRAIEALPASKQQTACSIAAGDLLRAIYVQTPPEAQGTQQRTTAAWNHLWALWAKGKDRYSIHEVRQALHAVVGAELAESADLVRAATTGSREGAAEKIDRALSNLGDFQPTDLRSDDLLSEVKELLRAALGSSAPAPGGATEDAKDEIAWLIECRKDYHTPATGYLALGGWRTQRFEWTTDVNRALRFARKVDAETLQRTYLDRESYISVAEHMWTDAGRAADRTREDDHA